MVKTAKLSKTVLVLILANAIPLFGVVLWGWNVFDLILLYWFESAIIGFYNIFKLAIVGKWKSLPIIPFFIVHYSGFMTGHLIFLYALFKPDTLSTTSFFFLPSLSLLLNSLYGLSFAILALIISHGISFFTNFLLKKEYTKLTVAEQMNRPYSRIVIMHISIVFVGVAARLGGGMIFLIFMILLKTGVDIYSHMKSHTKLIEKAQSMAKKKLLGKLENTG